MDANQKQFKVIAVDQVRDISSEGGSSESRDGKRWWEKPTELGDGWHTEVWG